MSSPPLLTIMLAIGVLPVKAEPVHADPSRNILILFLKTTDNLKVTP
jgi:hypothetical protein